MSRGAFQNFSEAVRGSLFNTAILFLFWDAFKRVIFDELIGWFGAFVLLGTQIFLWLQWLTPDFYAYWLFSAVGSFGIAVSAIRKQAYPAGVFGLFWFALSVFGLACSLVRFFLECCF